MEKVSSRPNVSIRSRQQTMRLCKITVISVISLLAHFSQGIAKFDTLPNLSFTLANTYVLLSVSQDTTVTYHDVIVTS